MSGSVSRYQHFNRVFNFTGCSGGHITHPKVNGTNNADKRQQMKITAKAAVYVAQDSARIKKIV
jgi:hypothetical protein